MSKPFKRRTFLKTAATAGLSAMVAKDFSNKAEAAPVGKVKPVVISSANGLQAAAKAMELIKQGKDALDAVIAGVAIVEADPKEHTVGYGGLPNEEGVVELDASVMHGPTCRGGAVAALRNIMHPAQVARLVMERTDHALLVGEGALKFAKAHGFKEQDLLTDEAREEWLKWKENLSPNDDWLPPHDEHTTGIGKIREATERHWGTINCDAIDLKGNISGCTTTSGLAFKIPGRVGDSPIFGAGLYVDNEIGAAGSTGRGEANLLSCSSVMIVDWMREGNSPEQACILACERVMRLTKMRRLLDENGRPNFNVKFYALNKRGEYGCAALWSGVQFAVNTGSRESKLVDAAYLYEKKE